MRPSTTTTTALLTLLPLALTTPIPPTQPAITPFPLYTVTNYTTGCSPAGCTYAFSISYTPSGTCGNAQICEPGFSTQCSGTDIQNAMVPCEDALITTNEIPGWQNVTLEVRHQWDQDVATGNGSVDGRFWAVANYTVVVGVGEGGQRGAGFEMGVGEVGGIA